MTGKVEHRITIDDWMVLDLHLKGAKLIIYAVVYHMSMHGKRGRYDGGLEYLMKWTECSKRGVIDALQSLIESGLITKNVVNNGRGHYCEYRATAFDEEKGELSSVKGEVSSVKGELSSPKYIDNKYKKEVSKDKSLDTKKEREAEFDIFWKAYPKKKGKQDALKSFLKIKVPLDTLLTSLEKQKSSAEWQKDGGQFVPHPATWLNGARWEDEVDELPFAVSAPKRREIKIRINEYGEEEAYYDEP